jgi:hypothetical protein
LDSKQRLGFIFPVRDFVFGVGHGKQDQWKAKVFRLATMVRTGDVGDVEFLSNKWNILI